MRIDSAVRLVFQLADGKQVGHLAVVTESDPERGILCELITTTAEIMGFELQFWLPHSERGLAWDWLRDVRVQIEYLIDEGSDEKTGYEATIMDCQLQDFMLLTGFINGDEPEWVSLVDDDWSWKDCEAPGDEVLSAAVADATRRATVLRKAMAAEGVSAKLYAMPTPMRTWHLEANVPEEAPHPHQRQPKAVKKQRRSRGEEAGAVALEAAAASPSSPSRSRGGHSRSSGRDAAGVDETDVNGVYGYGQERERGSRGGPDNVAYWPASSDGAPVDRVPIWSGGHASKALLPLQPEAKHIARMVNAIKALSSESVQELEAATRVLREASATSGTLGLAALLELKALPLLCSLLKRALNQLEQLRQHHADAPPPHNLDALLLTICATLVNAAHYAPARPPLHKLGAVELAALSLNHSEAHLEIGLALLQNLSLFGPACSDIMRCPFMEHLPRYLGGAHSLSVRLKALSVLQHLTNCSDHAVLLIRHNVIILLLQELQSRPNDDACRYKTLCCLVNLAATEPNASHFSNLGFFKCLSQFRASPELGPLVEHVLHNVSNSAEQAKLMQQLHMLPATYKESRDTKAQLSAQMTARMHAEKAQETCVAEQRAAAAAVEHRHDRAAAEPSPPTSKSGGLPN